MAQVADYVIANANGATVRADINAVFLAVSSTNSGTSEPSTMYAFMLWVDTTTNLIKLRNAANGAWITLGLSITASNTVDINGGAIDGTAIGASSASTGAFTTLAATGASDLDSSVIINDSGADVDFRVESDDYGHMLFVDGGNNRVGICGSVILPTSILEVSEAVAASSGINSLVTISATDGGVNMAGGEGPGILFKIPDDETNPSVGAQIGAFKESSDDSVSNTGLAFSVSQNDETLDRAVTIDSAGVTMFGTTDDDPVFNNAVGASIGSNSGSALAGVGQFSCSGGVSGRFNRTNEDGVIIGIHQAGTEEGTISVSGGTVSYNPFMGSHYTEISEVSPYIGTVMESIGTLVENKYVSQKRLPKCKISDTADSSAVYGVWFSDGTDSGDLVAAVGASWCRIHKDETINIGDLLVSNGDGTAKVQDDDIIRSKTIGKITSTVKKTTYDDDSYIVPVVLYCG